MLVSHDMIRMDILNVWGSEGVAKSEPLMIDLIKYGKENSKVTIMEGILPSKDYSRLFETAVKEYGENIFAFYYDLSFEETLNRHSTKPNNDEFGESEMRRWWIEKDYLPMIPETILNENLSFQDAVEMIYNQVTESKKQDS